VDYYCQSCGTLNNFGRNFVQKTDACCGCGVTNRWSKVQPQSFDYVLTANDRMMLRSFRIDPE
jgi:hypothetical protein